ncbi:MAG: glycosyltransferase family 39 protein [Candidatus Omnitrophica bacterium]|nr:glycosyltransferase family 39 protein [Candidatus Omnitrophota bacterium]
MTNQTESARRDVCIAILLVLAAFLFRLPLLIARQSIITGDEAVIGLMARHILQGEFPIYYWGQGYMGSLTAYVTALVSLATGMNGMAIQLSVFLFYELFLITSYFVVKKILGRAPAILSSLVLVVAPVMVTELSIKSLGAYSEILFLGALAFWFWLKVFEEGSRKFLFPLGLTLGVALWMNSLFILYIAAFLLLTFFRKEGFSGRALICRPANLISLEDFSFPLWLKLSFYAVHAIVIFYALQQIYIFFFGGFDGKILGFSFKEPAFQWKGVKKILLLVGGEAAILAWLRVGPKRLWQWYRGWMAVIGGILLGYAPALLFSLLGGEGYRLLHKSGAISSSVLGQKFNMIFLHLIPGVLWGLDLSVKQNLFWAAMNFASLMILLASIFFFLWMHRKNILNVFLMRDGIENPSFFFCILGSVVLALTFLSALVADRYLIPIYWVTAVCLGAFIDWLRRHSRGWGVLLIAPLFILYVHSNAAYARTRAQNIEAPKGLVDYLAAQDLKGGITDYDNSYRFNFYGEERSIFIPNVGILRRPQYREAVKGLKRRAFVLPKDSTNEKEFLESHPDFRPLDVLEYKTYRIYVVDETFPIQ